MSDADNARKLIAAAQELDAVATKGPWEQEGPVSSKIVWSGPDERVCFLTSDGNPTQNARFIAASRQLVPALADALQDALARIAELERDLKTVLDREAETYRRHDAKLDAAEAELARLRTAQGGGGGAVGDSRDVWQQQRQCQDQQRHFGTGEILQVHRSPSRNQGRDGMTNGAISREAVVSFLRVIAAPNSSVTLRLGGTSELVTFDEIIEAINTLPAVQPAPDVGALETLASIGSYLGAGIGDDMTTPDEYHKRIMWGIDYHASVIVKRCADIVEELSKRSYSGDRVGWGNIKTAILAVDQSPAPDVGAMVEALRSIAGNTCCDGCREAGRVAAAALAQWEAK